MAFRKHSKPLSPILAAIKAGDLAAVQAELDSGVSVETTNANLSTPLIVAAWHGHTDIVKLLLDRGAAIDHQNRDASSALSQAMYRGHTAIVRMLLEAGADLELLNKNGRPVIAHSREYAQLVEQERAMRSLRGIEQALAAADMDQLPPAETRLKIKKTRL